MLTVKHVGPYIKNKSLSQVKIESFSALTGVPPLDPTGGLSSRPPALPPRFSHPGYSSTFIIGLVRSTQMSHAVAPWVAVAAEQVCTSRNSGLSKKIHKIFLWGNFWPKVQNLRVKNPHLGKFTGKTETVSILLEFC